VKPTSNKQAKVPIAIDRQTNRTFVIIERCVNYVRLRETDAPVYRNPGELAHVDTYWFSSREFDRYFTTGEKLRKQFH
jgi:hypothetical protein